MSDSTLKELWQQVAEKKSCEAKQKELTAQRDTLADRLKKLEKSKLAEQADVDRLEGHSLAAFFYQVIGKMDEKLDKERQEAYAARVKYDAALHDLSSVDADLEQIQNRLARLSDCESQYQAALSEKIKSIKVSAHPAAQQIAESESRIAALKVQKRELLEAINAGKTALHTVNEVLETLHNAEGWSTWAMDYTGSIYRLIDRAEDEMKEYAQRVKQLSADEIYRHSAETAAKESLLSALIHDSYELDDDDLDLILKPKNPVEALYQFLTSDKTDLSSESSISSILSEYNAQCQERDLTLGEEVTMC